MTRFFGTSGFGLLRGSRTYVRASSVALSVLVLAATAMSLLVPAAFTAVNAGELRNSWEQGAPSDRYLMATTHTSPATGASDESSEALFGAFGDRLADVRSGFPDLLRGVTEPARWSLTFDAVLLSERDTRTVPRGSKVNLALRVDPQAVTEVRILEGAWPGSSGEVSNPRRPGEKPVEIALSEKQATGLGWNVGEFRKTFLLSAIFEPIDLDGDYWALNDSMIEPNIFVDNNNPPTQTATAFADPNGLGFGPTSTSSSSISVKIWYPIDISSVPDDKIDAFVDEVRQVSATPWAGSPDTTFTLTSAGLPGLETAQERVRAASGMLALVATAPIGTFIVVLLLGIRLLEIGRRPFVALLLQRGASPRRLRLLLAAEGLLIGIPSMLIAVAATHFISGSWPTRGDLLVALSIALLPAVLLALSPLRLSMRTRRADLGIRRRGSGRWIVELFTIVLTGVSLLLLFRSAGDSGAAVDPLVVVAPTLLAFSACIVVLRVYPLLLSGVVRRMRRSNSTAVYLGALTTLRNPVASVGAMFCVLVATSVAAVSIVTLSSISIGTRQAALSELGAELRYTGPAISDDFYDQVRRVPGVAEAARVYTHGQVAIEPSPANVGDPTLYLADLDALGRVQRGVPGAAPIPDGEGVVVSSGFVDPGEQLTSSTSGLDGQIVLGTAKSAAGVTNDEAWVIADAGPRDIGNFTPRTMLISVQPGADAAVVARGVRAVTPPGGTILTADGLVATTSSAPIARGVRMLLALSAALVIVAAITSIGQSLVLGARARRRQLTILRVVGVGRTQRRSTVLWEQIPGVATAGTFGVIVGVVTAWIAYRTLDVQALTGGTDTSGLQLRLIDLIVLLGVVLLMVLVTGGLTQWALAQESEGGEMRLDDEQ